MVEVVAMGDRRECFPAELAVGTLALTHAAASASPMWFVSVPPRAGPRLPDAWGRMPGWGTGGSDAGDRARGTRCGGWAARIPSGLAGLTAEANGVVVGEGAWRVTGLRGPWSILGPQVGARWLLCLLHWELKLLTASSDFLINYFF